jgi:hypothetical protein
MSLSVPCTCHGLNLARRAAAWLAQSAKGACGAAAQQWTTHAAVTLVPTHCVLCVCVCCVVLLLQSGTSHNLGDNFARAFNTQFVDEQQQMR